MTAYNSPKTAESNGLELSSLRRLQEIEHLVEKLVASWHGTKNVLQTRRWHRTGFEKPVVLTPLDDETEEPFGNPILASGRDVSLRGVSFLHIDPLPFRKVAITFPDDHDIPMSVVTCLKWCRFTREGLYHSGGNFLRTIELPAELHFGSQEVSLRSVAT